jgi:Kef-type K+ transport system membrane component KefB
LLAAPPHGALNPNTSGTMTPFELSVRFFLQLAVVLGVCRGVCWAAVRLGQPPVVGEMVAGVLLGPSLLGFLWPYGQQALFPPSARPLLFSAAQIGLSLYMFTVGLDFRWDLVRSRRASAAAISSAGILAPFSLGCGLAWILFRQRGYFTPDVTSSQAIPFMGAAMAITAFPMLARIIFERRLSGTRIGALALASGSIDDAAAWGVLALVLASLGHDPRIALKALGGGALFAGALFKFAPRPLERLAQLAARGEAEERVAFAWVLVILMLCSWFADSIGLYAVFGSFFFGAAMPRGLFAKRLQAVIEPLTTSLLLPLFFVCSGLNTRFDLMNRPALWAVAVAVLAAAVLGKTGACYFAARWCGEDHRDALGIGTLMNARGLMELIILNIGLERRIITATLFSILVFMAMVTTLMATPMFNWVARRNAWNPSELAPGDKAPIRAP